MKRINNPNSVPRLTAGAIMAGAMLLAAASGQAGQATTNVMSFSGSLGAWWLNSWGGQSSATAYDPTQDHTGDGGGSLYVVDDYSGGSQCVNIGWLDGQEWGGAPFDLTQWTNITFWVKWDTANSTLPIDSFNASPGDQGWQVYGSTANNGNWFTIGQVMIPDAASNGWAQVNLPIDNTIPGINASYVFGLKKWVNSGLTGVAAMWVDDVTLQGNPAASIPPPTVGSNLTKPAIGLNLFALTGPYNRESLESVNDQGFVGQSGSVSYSFTIAQGANGSGGAAYQNHIFLVSNPGTESSPDWNEPNVIFLDLESQLDGGATWTFRYKTNQPNANSMMYDATVVPGSISDSSAVGTWTVTFNNDTSVTMTSPSGNSTNFNFSNQSDLQTLFPSPLKAYFGCQANNAAGVGQFSTLSGIKITGTPNPLNDSFTGGASVNTNNWTTNAVDPGAVFVTPSDAALWMTWSIPDSGFTPQDTASLSSGSWTDISPLKLQVSGERWALLTSGMVPSGSNAYFRLIKRVVTQLQVLLPGETNAPNTATGKVGTPTPALAFTPVVATINAVDSTYHIVNSSDAISVSTSDPGATFTTSPTPSLVNGTATVEIYFSNLGDQTVTADDTTNTNVISSTSSPISISQ